MILLRPKKWTDKPPVGVQVDGGHPLAQKLVGAWILTEGGGRRLSDLALSQPVGTWNGPTWTQGLDLSFSGSQDFLVRRALNYIPLAGSPASAFCIVRPTSLTAINTFINVGEVTDSNATQTFYSTAANGNLSLDGNGTNDGDVGSTLAVVVNKWNSCAYAQRGGADRTFFLNGVFQNSSTSLLNKALASAGGLAIGRAYQNALVKANTGLTGQLRCAYLWDRALKNSELLWLYADPYAFLLPQSPRLRYFFPSVAVAAGDVQAFTTGHHRLIGRSIGRGVWRV